MDVLLYNLVRNQEPVGFGWFIVFNDTFNNISVISWQSVLLMEETGVPRENQTPAASYCQTLSHDVVLKEV